MKRHNQAALYDAVIVTAIFVLLVLWLTVF
jgi:hypothetical protein